MDLEEAMRPELGPNDRQAFRECVRKYKISHEQNTDILCVFRECVRKYKISHEQNTDILRVLEDVGCKSGRHKHKAIH